MITHHSLCLPLAIAVQAKNMVSGSRNVWIKYKRLEQLHIYTVKGTANSVIEMCGNLSLTHIILSKNLWLVGFFYIFSHAHKDFMYLIKINNIVKINTITTAFYCKYILKCNFFFDE